MKKIGVIKLSAFGDFMMAMGYFKAIREHHKEDHITLITTKSFKDLAETSGYFDAIIIDERPKLKDLKAVLSWRDILKEQAFDRVYDLQANTRTALYYYVMWAIPCIFKGRGVPEWAGTARFCDFYTPDERKKDIHAYERGKKILRVAGIEDVGLPDIHWMKGAIELFDLPQHYAVLVPGCAPTRPLKKWPAEHYAGLDKYLLKKGITPVLVGGPAELVIGEKLQEAVPEVINLIGQTSFYDLATLGRHSAFAVGNDTGPTHVLALSGCPTLTLFSIDSDPIKSRPIGAHAKHIRRDDLEELSVDEVVETLEIQFKDQHVI